MICRHCKTTLEHMFLDLGYAPPSNAYLVERDLCAPELYFPLKLRVCHQCWLVQTEDYARAEELFRSDYAYFSSTSTGWQNHAARYCSMITDKLQLSDRSFVVEVACNDGYLLKNFVKACIPCLGIEPTDSTAASAEREGIEVIRDFFGADLASRLRQEGRQADLIIGNNVYAHVPDINDFTAGLKTVLKSGGTITLEFPHLMRLIEHTQFDTVYHEHYSYLSLFTVDMIFQKAGLRIYDIEELQTHGGSLRVYGCHADDPREETRAVRGLLVEEERQGMRGLELYQGFQARVDQVKDGLLSFLLEQKKAGRLIVGYGAAAKGNTLFNYAGVKRDLVPVVFDAAPSKQGKFLPGSHIPVLPPQKLRELKPEIVLILPWNIAEEVMEQHNYVLEYGGRFAVAVPAMSILS